MMKIAVIGNSHVGAWKTAWSARSEADRPVDITWFAAAAQLIGHLEVRDGRIVPTDVRTLKHIRMTSGQREEIDPAEFDLFILCGGYRCDIPPQDSRAYSRAIYRKMIQGSFQLSLAYKIATLLRQLTDKPVYFFPNPLPAHANAGIDTSAFFVRESYADRIARIDKIARKALGASCVAQPASTVLAEVSTKTEYTKGSRRLGPGKSADDAPEHPESEYNHMNADYGALVVENMLRVIGQTG